MKLMPIFIYGRKIGKIGVKIYQHNVVGGGDRSL
jgi:hypothetical protein